MAIVRFVNKHNMINPNSFKDIMVKIDFISIKFLIKWLNKIIKKMITCDRTVILKLSIKLLYYVYSKKIIKFNRYLHVYFFKIGFMLFSLYC